MHVIDISHPHFRDQITVVQDTLRELHAGGKPTIHVFNKVDALESPSDMRGLREIFPASVFISAQRGINLGELTATLQRMVEEQHRETAFVISPPDFRIAAQLHREGRIVREEYGDDFIRVRCVVPPETEQRLLKTYAGLLRLDDDL